ncbi:MULTISPECIES: hypothetical protein [unclassified Nocardiopsis]|uniref:hypothetical protein n=1 Tax=Nocardiopsis TaxID=2013 RepID=UPI00387B7DAF
MTEMAEPSTPALFRDHLTEARALAEQAGADTALLDELSDIAAHADRAAVRIAVARGPVRERARLLEALAGHPVLPPGFSADLPVLVSPAAGDVWEVRTDLGWEVREGPSALDDRGVDAVRVGSPDLPGGVEFLLAPEDGGAPHSADAVLLPVAATAAFTLSDRTFLRELLDRGLAPDRVLLALVHTGRVDEEERDDVVQYVRERARELSPELGLAVAPPTGDGLADTLRAWLAGTVGADPGGARARHVAHRLASCLDRIGERAAEGEREAEAEGRRLAEAAAAARIEHEDRLTGFDLLREDVRTRRNTMFERLHDDRDRKRRQLVSDLLHDLDRNTNPQRWWTRDLPHRVERSLALWNEQIRLKLQPGAAQDLRETDEALHSAFGLRLRVPDHPQAGYTKVEVSVPDADDLTDLARRRVVYRVAPSGAALAAALLVPGFGPALVLAASVIGTTLGEVRLRTLAQEQRQTVRGQLPALVNTEFDACADAAWSELEQLYRFLEDEVGRSREEWNRRGHPLPAAAASGPDWSDIAVRTRELTAGVLAQAGPVETRGAGN